MLSAGVVVGVVVSGGFSGGGSTTAAAASPPPSASPSVTATDDAAPVSGTATVTASAAPASVTPSASVSPDTAAPDTSAPDTSAQDAAAARAKARRQAAVQAAEGATTTESGGTVAYGGQDLPDLIVAPPEKTDGALRLTVGLGDSITYRSGSWFRRVCGSGVVNTCRDSGIRGDTTAGMLSRLQTDVLDLHPDVVTVMAGTNDMLYGFTTAQSIRNIGEIVTQIRDSGATVVLCTIAPRNATPGEAMALNKAIRKYAKKHHVALFDVAPLLSTWNGRFKSGLTDDGVHPNARGMKLVADYAEQRLPALIK
nr:GDSL-type esterase/lipase family protein [Kineosporia mesophila]